MKRKSRKLISIMAVIALMIQLAVVTVGAVNINITQNTSDPSNWIYYGSMIESNRMIAPALTYEGNVAYCIGTSAEDTPSGQNMTAAGAMTENKLINIIAAGYPYTPSAYGINNRDYHYITQMAIRIYVEGRNPALINSANANFKAEFLRIYNSQNDSDNPTEVKTTITGSANRTLVMVAGVPFYLNGPYQPTVENGTLTSNYGVILTNGNAFHHLNSNPTTASNLARLYDKTETFYVFTPVMVGGSTEVRLNLPPSSISSSLQIATYTHATVQNVAIISLDTVYDPIKDPITLDWQTETGQLSVTKTTTGNQNISGIQFRLVGTSTIGIPIDITATTNSSGVAVFNYLGLATIPVGTFTLTETAGTVPVAYQIMSPTNITITNGSNQNIPVFNAEKTGSIQINKTTTGMVNLADLEFVLSGTSTSGRAISLTATTNSSGVAIFNGVPIGSYTVTEQGSSVPYAYLTADPEEVSVTYSTTTNIEISNEETGSIQINKTTPGMKNLADLTFVLSGTTDTGREISIESVTDEDGMATFNDIPIGSYIVAEQGSSVPCISQLTPRKFR